MLFRERRARLLQRVVLRGFLFSLPLRLHATPPCVSSESTLHEPCQGAPGSVFDLGPDGSMIAGFFAAASVAADACGDEPARKRRAQQQMVDAKPRVAWKCAAQVFPECIDALAGMQRSQGVDPALAEQRLIRGPDFGPEQRVVAPALRRIDVQVFRDDIEVARENDLLSFAQQLG